MKRFHVHLHVDNLAASVGFYSKLFAAEPSRLEGDYAKWMLEDPRLNFAISARGHEAGIDHLGFQTDDAAELDELKQRAKAADMTLLDEGATTCCYARSKKHWVTDPQGVAWEQFHTMGNVAVFGQPKPAAVTDPVQPAAACCATAPSSAEKPRAGAAASACC